jgi:S-formylglutathione hydrolase
MKTLKRHRCEGGIQSFHEHQSSATGTAMRFSVYTPPQATARRCPVVYWLSGLTCTDENFPTKAGAQRHAAEHGLILVAPDTSPRGAGIAGEDDSYDFGTGAGFYVNATTPGYAKHYKMYDYVTSELPQLVHAEFPTRPDAQGIMGHSMGGHGALVIGLRHPEKYQSVSAFAPIVAPSQVAWGRKAFTGYLGSDEGAWSEYDATALIAQGKGDGRRLLLIDQGTADEFLAAQLKPELLKEACEKAGQPLELRLREGYDHSYYFIASFIGEHLAHHARVLI